MNAVITAEGSSTCQFQAARIAREIIAVTTAAFIMSVRLACSRQLGLKMWQQAKEIYISKLCSQLQKGSEHRASRRGPTKAYKTNALVASLAGGRS